jgi:hypothetical protein
MKYLNNSAMACEKQLNSGFSAGSSPDDYPGWHPEVNSGLKVDLMPLILKTFTALFKMMKFDTKHDLS